MKHTESRWRNQRKKTEYSWASALQWELTLPPEAQDKKRIKKLRRRLETI